MTELLKLNLLSPLALAFALGVVAKLLKSELSLPKDLYASLSIYLLFAIGLKGGVELSHTTFAAITWPALVTVCLGCLTPVSTYLVLRKVGRFSISDSAGIAAHYGSVSAVTFIAAQQFVGFAGTPAEGFMPTLLTLLESPGIHLALAIGAVGVAKERAARQAREASDATALVGTGIGIGTADTAQGVDVKAVLHEILTARTMVLLVGGLVVGYLMGEPGWKPVEPFFNGGFKGALTLFLLEMGLLAGERIGDLKRVGPFLIAFGTIMPILHGAIGVALGHWAGLSVGGCTVLGTMAASASYIAAPPAVRVTLPEANPTYYLTLSLAVTFPFNILVGIPLYHRFATMMAGL